MFVKIQFITRNISIISLTFWLLFETCQCLPQLQGGVRNINNDFRGQEGRQNNNRNSITTNRPPNRGQRVLEGGFVPSDFGNELRNVKFPDGTSRQVGRRQPQRSPFRSSDPNVETAVQNRRRPNIDTPISNERRPDQARQPQRPQRPPRFLPALPVAHKYTRPRFDVLGMPLIFKPVVPEEGDLLPDFRDPSGTRNRDKGARTTKRPRFNRPKSTNLGPDLRPRLPIFGQPELILKATEELRNSDINQNAIISLGAVNAGVLPLAIENDQDQQLGFFPPFNVRPKIQPK